MSLDQDQGTPRVAAEWARFLITLSQANSRASLDALVAASFSGTFQSLLSVRTDVDPAWYVAVGGNVAVIGVEGCNNLQQGLSTAEGYITNGLNTLSTAPHFYFDRLANAVLAACDARNLHVDRTVFAAGHSLGGAVVAVIHKKLRQRDTRYRVNSITFGAPKGGFPAEMAYLDGGLHHRFFNSDDPVPLVFPTSADSPQLLLVVPLASYRRIESFVQPAGGLEITSAAAIRAGILPSQASIDATGNLGAWLTALNNQHGHPHDLDEYAARLDRHVAQHAATANVPAPMGLREVPVAAPRAVLTQQEQRVYRAFRTREVAQREAIVVIPDANRVTVQHVRPYYRVVWQGSPIAIVTGRRHAHAIARHMNSFLLDVQRTGVVDADHLQEAFNAYLHAAQVGGGGFSPPLQTTVPVPEE